MSVLALPTSALQRHSAKRVIGFLSIPHFDSGMELARSRYKQELCEIMRVTLVEIIKTWQTVAIRKGGLILRHGVDTIRCIPMVGFVMGDYKEFTNLSCTLPNTRCHFCCTSMKPVSSEIAVPRHKRSEIMALRKDPDEIPKAVNTRFDALPSPVHSPKTHTDHPSDQIGSLETSKDVFGDEPADRLFPYDLLRTFYLGPSRDALIAAIWCGNLGNTSNFSDLKVKLSKRSGSIPYLGLQGVKLQDYLHEAGHLEHNCLERKLQAKDIMPLFRGIVTAFIHDSLFPYEGRKLDLSMNFRSIVWTLASFVVVGHELERQSQPQGALPILRENIDKAVHVANTYRVQLEEKPTSSLFLPQLHALRHLSEMTMHTGGIGVLDNDHFDQYSLSTKRIIAQVGNVDDKSLHKLWRCIELDVASDFMPELPPVRLPRCQLKGAHTNFAACSAASLAKQILQHLASTFHQNVAHRSAGLERSILSSFAEESSTGESENSASPRFESYKNATMRTRHLNAWGSADKASELPTVLLSEAGDLFAPLEFIQKQNTKKRECPSNPNFCIAVQIEIDSLSHSKLAHKTYRQQQLCGFRIANGDRVNVANIVCRNIEEFACCYVFKLRPNNPSCKLLVCWPAGETAPSNWTSSPFFQDYLPTPKQPLDDFDDIERCQTRLEEHHYKDLGQKNVENIKANRSRLV